MKSKLPFNDIASGLALAIVGFCLVLPGFASNLKTPQVGLTEEEYDDLVEAWGDHRPWHVRDYFPLTKENMPSRLLVGKERMRGIHRAVSLYTADNDGFTTFGTEGVDMGVFLRPGVLDGYRKDTGKDYFGMNRFAVDQSDPRSADPFMTRLHSPAASLKERYQRSMSYSLRIPSTEYKTVDWVNNSKDLIKDAEQQGSAYIWLYDDNFDMNYYSLLPEEKQTLRSKLLTMDLDGGIKWQRSKRTMVLIRNPIRGFDWGDGLAGRP